MNPITQAVEVLKKGGIVVYPTDTAYGLAVDATNAEAVEKLYRLKGRDFKKPTHVIFPNTTWLKKIVKLNKEALKLMNEFLPGPLTIVLELRARGKSWQKLSAGTKTMGVRYPNHPISSALVELLKKPITTTSANISGKDNCYSIDEVKGQLGKNTNLNIYFLDGGKLRKTKPSTVVSLVNGVTILREGPISEAQIRKVLV